MKCCSGSEVDGERGVRYAPEKTYPVVRENVTRLPTGVDLGCRLGARLATNLK